MARLQWGRGHVAAEIVRPQLFSFQRADAVTASAPASWLTIVLASGAADRYLAHYQSLSGCERQLDSDYHRTARDVLNE